MQKEMIQGIEIGLVVSFAVIVFVLILGYYVWNVEQNTLVTQRINLDIGLKESLKIVFVSDFHIGTRSDEFLELVVEKINAEKPDYILLGGDFVEGRSEIKRLGFLGRLDSSNGIYSVLGNHDYYLNERFCIEQDENEVADLLSSMNITVLSNQRVDLDGLILVGLDDDWACRSDYWNATRNLDHSEPVILLAHNQEAVPDVEYKKNNLVLVGHTHCGQVRLPLIGSIPKMHGFKGEYDAGLHQFDNDSYIYTTCGISGGPRFLAPPEITVLEVS